MINEKLQALGRWKLGLKTETPVAVIDKIEFVDHIYITEARLSSDLLNDASIKAAARYAGVVLSKPRGDELSIGGQGLLWWLGDAEGKGKVFYGASALTFNSVSFANAITTVLAAPSAITVGTLGSLPGTYSAEHSFQTQRRVISKICDAFGAEFRVNPDFTLDADDPSNMYKTTPETLVARRLRGSDPSVQGLVAERVVYEEDFEDYTTKVVLAAEGTGDTLVTAERSLSSVPYTDPQGNSIDRTRIINEPETDQTNAGARAQLQLNRFSQTRRNLRIVLEDFWVAGSLQVGDNIWVWDPEALLVDTANEVRYRGQVLNPVSIRLVGMSWPVKEGMGVYIRHQDGSYTDISDYFIPEGAPIEIEVGSLQRTLTSPDSTPLDDRANTNPDGNDSTTPNQPTFVNTPWSTTNYVDDEGAAKSRILVEWSDPTTNTDASTILDPGHIEVRWRRQGETSYQYTQVAWGVGSLLIQDLSPGITYEISVQAVDAYGNASGWPADQVVSASADTTPPSTPAAPTVAGNPLAIQVSHQLGRSTGGTFNLESDIDHLNVYVGTSSGFTPSASNKAGEIPATASHLALGITVIGTFNIPDSSPRYVKVTAVDRAGNESAPSAEATVTATLIDTQQINDLAVTTAKIADLAVSNAKIADLAYDKITAGTNTASLTIGSGGSIASSNYSAGTAGFIINGDGSAEFNNVTVRGDLVSSNWDGGSDLSGGPDAGATQGFFFDSSAGSGQFEGSLYVGGDILFTGVGSLRTASAGARMELRADANDQLLVYSGKAGETAPGYVQGTSHPTTSQGAVLIASPDTGVGVGKLFVEGKRITADVPYEAPAGSVSSPAYSFQADPNTGIYWWGADAMAMSTGGNRMIWIGPSQTRFYSGIWFVGPSNTVAGPRYMSWYMADETTRAAWMGFGGANEHFGLYNERPAGNISFYAHNGASVVSRIVIDADGASLFYGSTGDEVIRLQTGYVRLAVGAALQFNGTTVPRLELGANNSVQVTNSSGWLQIGPQNTSYCHIYTDRPNFYFNKGLLVNGSTVWHSGNDGSGSGLDADLLDGVQGANYLRSDVSDTFNGSTLYAGSILPRSDANYNLGSSTRRWNVVYRVSESSSSDRRSKKHLSDQVPGLALVTALRPRRFKYKGHTDEWWWGFVAQEVADVVDVDTHEIIHTDPEGMMGLNYEQLIAPLVKAVQELKAEVDELRDQLGEGRIAA